MHAQDTRSRTQTKITWQGLPTFIVFLVDILFSLSRQHSRSCLLRPSFSSLFSSVYTSLLLRFFATPSNSPTVRDLCEFSFDRNWIKQGSTDSSFKPCDDNQNICAFLNASVLIFLRKCYFYRHRSIFKCLIKGDSKEFFRILSRRHDKVEENLTLCNWKLFIKNI